MSFKVFIKTLNDIYPTFNFSVCNLLRAKRKTAEGTPPFAFGKGLPSGQGLAGRLATT